MQDEARRMMAIYGWTDPGLCMRGWSIDRGHIIIALSYSMARGLVNWIFPLLPSLPKPFAVVVTLGLFLGASDRIYNINKRRLTRPRDSVRNKVNPLHGSISLYLLWCSVLFR